MTIKELEKILKNKNVDCLEVNYYKESNSWLARVWFSNSIDFREGNYCFDLESSLKSMLKEVELNPPKKIEINE